MATRNDLMRRLAKLEAGIPEMKRRYPSPVDFAHAFAVHADALIEDTSQPDMNWAFDQIDVLLERYGLSTDQDEAADG